MLKDFVNAIEQDKINKALIKHYRLVVESQKETIEELLRIIDKYQHDSLEKEINEREEA